MIYRAYVLTFEGTVIRYQDFDCETDDEAVWLAQELVGTTLSRSGWGLAGSPGCRLSVPSPTPCRPGFAFCQPELPLTYRPKRAIPVTAAQLGSEARKTTPAGRCRRAVSLHHSRCADYAASSSARAANCS